jgi:uncharacterized membrane protein YbaN (DUF454 family)
VSLVKSPVIRWVLIGISVVSLIVGMIGAFLPVLPTTPFVLLSACCYARSSVRFYNWLMNHRVFGPPLRKWKESGAIARRHKILAITMITLSVGSSIIFFIPILAVRIFLGVFAAWLILFIGSRPE